jgi:hypothetical protein
MRMQAIGSSGTNGHRKPEKLLMIKVMNIFMANLLYMICFNGKGTLCSI